MSWRERHIEQSEAVRRRRERAADHVERIITAARQLYYETNGEAFTIQQLVERAGVATQTFYRHFRSKDELLLAVLEDVIIEGTEGIRKDAMVESDPLDRLKKTITLPILRAVPQDSRGYSMVLVREHYRLSETYPKEVAHFQDAYLDLLIEFIEAASTSGDLPPRKNVQRDARLLRNLATRTFNNLALGVEEDDLEAVAAHTWTFCLAGLRA
jgi:TetR/AcrR family transcriptional regulator